MTWSTGRASLCSYTSPFSLFLSVSFSYRAGLVYYGTNIVQLESNEESPFLMSSLEKVPCLLFCPVMSVHQLCLLILTGLVSLHLTLITPYITSLWLVWLPWSWLLLMCCQVLGNVEPCYFHQLGFRIASWQVWCRSTGLCRMSQSILLAGRIDVRNSLRGEWLRTFNLLIKCHGRGCRTVAGPVTWVGAYFCFCKLASQKLELVRMMVQDSLDSQA